MVALANDLPPGFADPVADANAVFRAVLSAISYPGRIVPLPVAPAPPPPLSLAAAAILLTLADLETPVWLSPGLDGDGVRAWLAFHCGCPLVVEPGRALFAVTESWDMLSEFSPGTAENPEQSATVILQVDSLRPGRGMSLRGPGIPDVERLEVPGAGPSLVRALAGNHRLFPRGVDVVLAAAGRLACLPRTIQVTEEASCMSR
ncbi:MAG: phosphonate C-P lyase system protein PhnH [Telmatospirillum sp.]|nr:phosphonate C-P lyase system protein PhnH [Telmatospirillum sp.]